MAPDLVPEPFPDKRSYRISVTDQLAELYLRVAALEQRLGEIDAMKAPAKAPEYRGQPGEEGRTAS